MSPRARLFALSTPYVLAGALLVTACGSDSQTNSAPDNSDSSRSPELVVRAAAADGLEAILDGTLGVNDQNCVTLDGAVVSAPQGSKVSDSGDVLLAGYDPMTVGDDVRLVGGLLDDLTEDDIDEATRSCVPAAGSTITVASIAEGPVPG